ncbi:ricin-type beta-trefoil lectin domain protein [Streptomyces sp. NPDC059718]
MCVPFLVPGSDSGEGGSTAAPRPGSAPGIGSSPAGTVPASPLDVTRPSPGRTPGQPSAGVAASDAPPSPRDPEVGEAAPKAESGEVPASVGPSSSEVVPGVAIRSHASRRCIDAGSAEGVPLRLRDCTVGAGQSWRIVPEDRSIRIAGTCMDVAGGSTADGGPSSWPTATAPHPRGSGSTLPTTWSTSRPTSAWRPWTRTEAGTTLRLWTCTGADNQKWSAG